MRIAREEPDTTFDDIATDTDAWAEPMQLTDDRDDDALSAAIDGEKDLVADTLPDEVGAGKSAEEAAMHVVDDGPA